MNQAFERPQHFALAAASRDGHIEVVRYLLDRGANVNQRDLSQLTALHQAVMGEHAVISKLLLEHKAAPSPACDTKITPLHLAAGKSKELVDLLLARGADVNALDVIRDTPLHRAAGAGKADVIPLLAAKKADVNAIGEMGAPLTGRPTAGM